MLSDDTNFLIQIRKKVTKERIYNNLILYNNRIVMLSLYYIIIYMQNFAKHSVFSRFSRERLAWIIKNFFKSTGTATLDKDVISCSRPFLTYILLTCCTTKQLSFVQNRKLHIKHLTAEDFCAIMQLH